MKTAILILALVFTAALHADPVVKISGYVLSKTDAGLLVICDRPAHNTIGVKAATGTIFLKDHPQQAALFDRARIHCRAEATGLYEYTSVLGAHKTVQEFTCEK